MHTNVTNFKLKKKNDLSIDGWNGLLEANQKKLNLLEEILYINLRKEHNRIENLWPRDLPSWIIHADLFPDNVLFLNNKVSGLIDFYFSCNDFFAYDLSICINAWCFNKENKFSREIFKSLLKGYQELRSLSEKELESKMKQILDDHKTLINITPEEEIKESIIESDPDDDLE